MKMHVFLLQDINDCADQPYQNGGNCTDAVNDYNCNCAAGYSGKNCSVGKDDFHILKNRFRKATLECASCNSAAHKMIA